MCKTSKLIYDCKPGEILAEDIMNSRNILLVVKNTVLNEFIKEKLIELGIRKVQVYEQREVSQPESKYSEYELMRKNYSHLLSTVKYILQKLSANSLHYKEVELVTDAILKFIHEPINIIQYLNQVKDNSEYTYQHSVNVAFYAMLTSRWLKLTNKDIRNVIQAALLHDIGKLETPPEILNKNGSLTDEEYEIIKKHPESGYRMLKDNPTINNSVKETILQHHERIDGSGYPYQLKGDQINLYARIIAICDVFDAMTQDRVYKEKVSPFDTFKMFLSRGLTSFDIHTMHVFITNISPYYIGAWVRLSDGKEGQIVYIPPQNILYPVVGTGTEYIDLGKNTDLKIVEIIQM